jgi:hypothetical protein
MIRPIGFWFLCLSILVSIPACTPLTPEEKAEREKRREAEQKQREEREAKEGSTHRKAEIWVLAQEIVTNNCKSPSTASFGGFGEQTYMSNVQFLGDGVYKAYGFVDAQNAFGAVRRANWSVEMKYENGDWKLLKQSITER